MGDSNKVYRSLSIPGKGIGMIAEKNIKKGEMILEELPVLYYEYEEHLDTLYDYKAFSKFKSLSIKQKEAVMKLENSRPNVGKDFPSLSESFKKDEEFKKWSGIMVTNQARLLENSRGLFLIFSRFNHSCVPNLNYETTGSNIKLFAIRDISKGEELCISYIRDPYTFELNFSKPPTLKNIHRYLKDEYGFECKCQLCCKKKKDQEEINRYRIKYMALYKAIDTCTILDGNEQLALLIDLFETMEKGNVQSLDLTSHYAMMGFNLTLMWEQFTHSKYFIEKAYNAKLGLEGENGPTAKYYLELIKNPSMWRMYIDEYMEKHECKE